MSKNVLKLGLYSVILLLTVTVESQRQRGPSQNISQGQQAMPVFNAENAAGILTYNDRKVIKKTKLETDKEKDSVKKIISEYNHAIEEIKSLHSRAFRTAEEFVAEKRREAMTNRDREAMRSIQSETMQKLNPIRRIVRSTELRLNDKLKPVFSEEQYGWWLDYQKSKKQALRPKRPDNTEGGRPVGVGRGNSRQGNNGGRQGNF